MPTIKIEVTQTPEGAYKFEFSESQKELLTLAMGLGEGALKEACLGGATFRYCSAESREQFLSEFLSGAERMSEKLALQARRIRAERAAIIPTGKKVTN